MSEGSNQQAVNAYIAIGQHEETGLFHGMVYRNHKKPSGLDRWLLSLSTKDGFQTERLAGEFMNAQFPELAPTDLTKLNDINAFADIPELPAGAEVTVMTYNSYSEDPAPKEAFPKVVVTLAGKPTGIKLSGEQMAILIKQKKIELDSTTDRDPGLSCVYTHYSVVSTQITRPKCPPTKREGNRPC